MSNKVSGLNLALAALLFFFESAGILFVLSGYRYSSVEGLDRFVGSPSGILCLVALLLLIGTGGYILRYVRRLPPPAKRQASLTASLNFVTVLMTIVAGEASLRALHELGIRIPSVQVNLPMLRSWERTSGAFLEAIHNQPAPYHDYDPELGWTIARNRTSHNGLYASSTEGLRSASPGETLLTWGLAAPGKTGQRERPYRVALLGDSFTFGYEVAHDETWAQLIAKRLQPEFDIVNFGVVGYSVNQIRMKYERDVRPLHPDLIVVGLISQDFLRDTSIYNFLPYPEAVGFPYARPRPILRDGQLAILNTPVPSPKEVFHMASVHELPFLRSDVNYNWLEWERPAWHLLQRSLLFRAVASWPPGPSSARKQAFEREQRLLNRMVLQTLADSAEKEGSELLFLSFPQLTELPDSSGVSGTPPPPYAPGVLTELGLPYEEMSGCVRTVSPERRFAPEGHYSAETNAALASCLVDIILQQRHQPDPAPAVVAHRR